MIESTGQWGDLMRAKGAYPTLVWGALYIRDDRGNIWKVEGVGPDDPDDLEHSRVGATIRNADDVTFYVAKPSDHPVQILIPTAEETAVKIVQDRLGGQKLAHIEVGEPEWTAYANLEEQPVSKDVASIVGMRYHLETMHGIYAGDFADEAHRIRYHKQLHEPGSPTQHAIKHRHA